MGVIRNSMAVKGFTRVKKDHRGIRRGYIGLEKVTRVYRGV